MNRDIHKRVLLVDDAPKVLASTALILVEEGYEVVSCSDADCAMEKLSDNNIDVVLTDVRMPDVSGLDLLENIRKLRRQLPVILMTAYADFDTAVDAISKGAFDFLIKPASPEYILHSIKKAFQHVNYLKLKESHKQYLEETVRQRTSELELSRNEADMLSRELVERLTTVAEFRDLEAGFHVARIGIFSELIANALNMPADFVRTIKNSSPLHDIGKIGITDYILFKLGTLAPEEITVIKSHCTEGARILSGSPLPVMQMASSIALTHHERWDGTGYPNGLKGENIPIEGRIVNIVDQYDALTRLPQQDAKISAFQKRNG